MLNKIGPTIDPCGTPDSTFNFVYTDTLSSTI